MKHIKAILSLLYVIPCAFILFFYNLAKKNPKTQDPNQVSILLIHGYLYRSGGWAYIRYHLRRAGHHNIYSLNLGSPFQSIEDYSQKVKEQIERMGAKEIILIGHSMGGLIATYYDCAVAKPGSIKQVITLGSPLEGTSLAVIGFGKCASQMKPHSSFLKSLSTHHSETPYLHIASDTDWIIRPWQAALFNSSQASHIKRKVFDSIGHLQLLFSKRIVDVIVAQLANNSIKP